MANHGWSFLAVLTVCSAGAASPMAEETVAGEADSTAKVAFVCALWSAGVAALLSAYPLFFCCVHQFLFPLGCWFRVLLHLVRSAARSSQDSASISSAFISLRQISLYRNRGWPALHRGCLLGCGHRSCSGHDPASAVCAG